MNRYVCVHGHFHQPARENPWLERIELQDSAYPYHDWTERVTAECYAPNASARILDAAGSIARIVNNYERISFDVGPTLLRWLEEHAPATYEAILKADLASRKRFSGHGSAMVMPYNHMVMPLASARDKRTQLRWAIKDFERRFRRSPEGAWLPETAVDRETLEVLADHGIAFTLLAPSQALAARPGPDREWTDVSGGRIDPRRPYYVQLAQERGIAVFFFDAGISRSIAFEHLLDDGHRYARRLLAAFREDDEPQLVHVASDGETYGHHHRHGEMALAYALERIDEDPAARLTNYGEYLSLYPAQQEVRLAELTAWSCSHGLGRWTTDCGCRSAERPQWNQRWRTPLREAMDGLRDAMAPLFEGGTAGLLQDPWRARDEYIQVVMDRSEEKRSAFLEAQASRELTSDERVRVLQLLEAQRHAMLMFTSCGWFIDDLSSLETVQVMSCAARAMQLTRLATGEDLEPGFLEIIAQAKSNIAAQGDGRTIYEKRIAHAAVDLDKVAAHYAISSLLARRPESASVYCYDVSPRDFRKHAVGNADVVLGCARFTSRITTESRDVAFAVMHFGHQNVSAGVRSVKDEDSWAGLLARFDDAAARGDVATMLRTLDGWFDKLPLSISSLFLDEQRKFLDEVLHATLSEDESLFKQVYDRRAPLMRTLTAMSAPLPSVLKAASEFVINAELRRELSSASLAIETLQPILEDARRWEVALDVAGLGFALQKNLEEHMERLHADPLDADRIDTVERLVGALADLPFSVDLFRVQNLFHGAARMALIDLRERADEGDETSRRQIKQFLDAGRKLGLSMNDLEQETGSATLAAVVKSILREASVPLATYRLQLGPSMDFAAVRDLTEYFQGLGVTHCYLSPIFQARRGSSHGYDVCNHGVISQVLGGEEALLALSGSLRERGLGVVLDTVPNHMGIGDPANIWWNDVLENGPSSSYAHFFDIEWSPVKPELADKVLIPVLEDQYGRVLEAGKLSLAYEEGSFVVWHYDTRLPVAPRTYANILRHSLETLTSVLGPEHGDVMELQSIITGLGYLPKRTELDPEKVAERNREKEVAKMRIARLCAASPTVRRAVEASVAAFNGRVGDPRSFDLLDQLLEDQAYRPAFWRVAAEEINYRRFFDVNDLAAIRTEDPDVFRQTHQLVLRLLCDGVVSGLRVDHIDGLNDPGGYLQQLQREYLTLRARRRLERGRTTLPDDETLQARIVRILAMRQAEQPAGARAVRPLYVVAEKILGDGERIPDDWAVAGTTGYEFLAQVNGLFVDGSNERAIDRLYAEFTGRDEPFAEIVVQSKTSTMENAMVSEITVLSHQLERIAARNRRYRDFTLGSLTAAVREYIAALDVYRTYVTEPGAITERDRTYVEGAIEETKRRNPAMPEEVTGFLRDTLLLENLGDFRPEEQQRLVAWVRKFQQLTGPVMAKGVEDTAYYVYNRLVSLNEVGSHPNRFGVDVATFHQHNVEFAVRHPHGLLTTSTHDTKRGEDVRARISVLSEIPGEWAETIERWTTWNAVHKTSVDDEAAPDRNDEYLLYQTLTGALPMEMISASVSEESPGWASLRERACSYMAKATKEAKVHTSWMRPDREYDDAVRSFVQALLTPGVSPSFLPDLQRFTARVAFFGMLNGLSQLALKLTCPGVPDIYQGTELWDLSLVDPDNRRPVDYGLRQRFLGELKSTDPSPQQARALLETAADGRIKMHVLMRVLELRRARMELFEDGGYVPLQVRGSRSKHVVAFLRGGTDDAVLVATSRLHVELCGGQTRYPAGPDAWGDTRVELPSEWRGASWMDAIAGRAGKANTGEGGSVAVGELLADLPAAVATLKALDR